MKQTVLRIGLAAMLAFSSSFALAHGCPRVMKSIDEALPSAKLSAADMDAVKKLRADGEAQHKSGQHDESMASLNKAKSMLGLK